MFEVSGKYNTAKIFTDVADNESISQIIELCNQSYAADSQIRLMPDIHAGAGCTIGTTMTIKDKICPNLVGCDIGCLDKDTEVLTPKGWIPINQYANEPILVYDKLTDTTFYDKPYAYIKQPCEKFYHFYSKKGLDQMLSEEHKMLLWKGYKGKGYNTEIGIAKEIYEKHNNTFTNINRAKYSKSYYSIKTTFNYKQTPLNISDDIIRVWVMVSADGCIRKQTNSNKRIELHFSKLRKIQRAELLLKNANISYNKYTAKNNTVYITFNTSTPIQKSLIPFYCASKEQLAILIDEIYQWDGTIDINRNHKQFSSSDKNNADVVQFALAANGIRAGINTIEYDIQKNWNTTYQVYETQNEYVGFPSKPFTTQPSKDGFKYCFTTSTGFFIIRRNNKISITGNCGTLTIKLEEKDIDLEKLDNIIRTYVPSGFDIHETPTENGTSIEKDLKQLNCKNHINLDRALKSVGTLGGGNHFIEVDKDDDNNLYLVIHTGSRHLGIEIAKYYQELAYKELNTISKADINNIINKLKSEHKESLIEQTLKEYKASHIGAVNIPKQLAYVQGNSFDAYIHDMFIAQDFASLNRHAIAEIISKQMNLHIVDTFETIHNYIDIDNMILRKGAVSAQKNERLLIPINMKDGSLLCTGKGNPDWNYSAPHGAGRLMSRSQAKEAFTVSEFNQQMSDIFTTSVSSATLDECPMAYKNINDILDNIGPTVTVDKIIKPVYNFKA